MFEIHKQSVMHAFLSGDRQTDGLEEIMWSYDCKCKKPINFHFHIESDGKEYFKRKSVVSKFQWKISSMWLAIYFWKKKPSCIFWCFLELPLLPWLWPECASLCLCMWTVWLKLAWTTLVLAQAAAWCVNSLRSRTPLWTNKVQVCCRNRFWLLLLISPWEWDRKSWTWASVRSKNTEQFGIRKRREFVVNRLHFILRSCTEWWKRCSCFFSIS